MHNRITTWMMLMSEWVFKAASMVVVASPLLLAYLKDVQAHAARLLGEKTKGVWTDASHHLHRSSARRLLPHLCCHVIYMLCAACVHLNGWLLTAAGLSDWPQPGARSIHMVVGA